jgi:hypothetical protein
MVIADVVLRIFEVGMLFLAFLFLLPLTIDFFKKFAPQKEWPDDGPDRRGER